MLNITRVTAQFMAHMIGAVGARDIPETGTANACSTLSLADAVALNGGQASTVGMAPFMQAVAAKPGINPSRPPVY
ncbi:hypothetical protein CR152_26800 [Massilia violaceinigra]|uniref:Uncharacterized protein n=1 Tax=Massilia violaceinigra TaxID=2045208 RepID=A0A2D2DRX0_9BURK|nr:hypothetical protein [Massilia violaceinigra]ATQ77713.1 hypothetical protein CR152_26800 [Massilia violaceinigra]